MPATRNQNYLLYYFCPTDIQLPEVIFSWVKYIYICGAPTYGCHRSNMCPMWRRDGNQLHNAALFENVDRNIEQVGIGEDGEVSGFRVGSQLDTFLEVTRLACVYDYVPVVAVVKRDDVVHGTLIALPTKFGFSSLTTLWVRDLQNSMLCTVLKIIFQLDLYSDGKEILIMSHR